MAQSPLRTHLPMQRSLCERRAVQSALASWLLQNPAIAIWIAEGCLASVRVVLDVRDHEAALLQFGVRRRDVIGGEHDALGRAGWHLWKPRDETDAGIDPWQLEAD